MVKFFTSFLFCLLTINVLIAQNLLSKSELFQQKEYSSLANAVQNPDTVYRLALSTMRYENFHSRIVEGKTGAGIHIESIPAQIFPAQVLKLYKLQILQIQYHELYEIPNEIDTLKNLQVLDLGHNSLTKLPASLTKLEHLEGLDLRNNAFSSVPEVIYDFPKLRVINLSGNPIRKEEIEELKQKLKELEIIW